MKSFTRGQIVEIRLQRRKEWTSARYIQTTDGAGASGWHHVTIVGGGELETVPDARIRQAPPAVTASRATATAQIVRACLEQAGLVLDGDPSNFFTTTDGRWCTARIFVPTALIDEHPNAAAHHLPIGATP